MKAADLFPFRHELRAGTLKAVSQLPEEHLGWKPQGGVHTLRDWLWHMAGTEDWWVQAVIHGRAEFAPRRRSRLCERSDLLQYLAEARRTTEAFLQEWTVDAVLRERRQVPTGPRRGSEMTVLDVLQAIFQHEAHHRGQIYLYLRLMGIEPPPG